MKNIFRTITTIFQNIFGWFRAFVCGSEETQPRRSEEPGPTEQISEPSPPSPRSDHPYREPPASVAEDDGDGVIGAELVSITGDEKLPESFMNTCKDKSKRRAIRYFKGKEVKHRVTYKSKDEIELEFNREGDPGKIAGKSVRIRWKKTTTGLVVDA
jgi:hypothetical protein